MERRMAKFKIIDRNTQFLFPPTIDDWLPENHLARFIVEIIEQLDLNEYKKAYRGSGSEAYDPSIMLGLLFYGYSTGVFSSRKIERATYDSVAFRYICREYHPDHDTIAEFRKRFLTEMKKSFEEILLIAKEMGQLKLGTISLDGTKVKANASKHKALSWKYANELEKQIHNEIQQLLNMAEEADNQEPDKSLDINEELLRRQDRLAKISAAKKEIEARAKARHEEAQKEYQEKMEERKKKEETEGKKPRGKTPKPPESEVEPEPKDQVNLTDEESRIMPQSGGGFEQCYNAQASVDIENMLILTNHITQNSNDKKEVIPTINELDKLPKFLGTPDNILCDAGYYSETNVNECVDKGLNPYIVEKRDKHNQFLAQHLAKTELQTENTNLSNVDQMKKRMQTSEGKALYSKRKSTVEPVFGIIKNVIGFRQFLLRGKEAVSGEWNLVCAGFNLKRLHQLSLQAT